MWLVFLFFASIEISANTSKSIPIYYSQASTPIDLPAFYQAFGKAVVFIYQQCDTLFYLVSIDDSDINKNENIKGVVISWNKLPYRKLGATENKFLGGNWHGAQIYLSPTVPKVELHRVIAHELGHVLGLVHSMDATSLMHEAIKGDQFGEVEKSICRQR